MFILTIMIAITQQPINIKLYCTNAAKLPVFLLGSWENWRIILQYIEGDPTGNLLGKY